MPGPPHVSVLYFHLWVINGISWIINFIIVFLPQAFICRLGGGGFHWKPHFPGTRQYYTVERLLNATVKKCYLEPLALNAASKKFKHQTPAIHFPYIQN